jgi:hypothetical protein
MEMICPECMGTLETSDGQSALCATHGGEFRILFSHWRPAPPPPPSTEEPAPMTFQLTPGAVCYQHASSPAACVCHECGTPICNTCAFEDSAGGQLCPNCIARQRPKTLSTTADVDAPIPAGVSCVQHRSVPATRQCKLCGAFMCATCDFSLPGGLHACPKCATAPRSELSSRRKKLLIGSYALAIFSTFGMTVVMSGALAEMARSREGREALGFICMGIALVPSLVGMALGFSAVDRRLANPMSLWIATIWNIIILSAFLLLSLIGILRS